MAVNIFSVILLYGATPIIVLSLLYSPKHLLHFSRTIFPSLLLIFVYFHKNGTECIFWLKTSTKWHCLTKVWFLPRGNYSLCQENQENGTFLAKYNHGGEKLVPVRVLCTRFYIWKLSQSREINESIPWIERKTRLKRVRLPHVYQVSGHPEVLVMTSWKSYSSMMKTWPKIV